MKTAIRCRTGLSHRRFTRAIEKCAARIVGRAEDELLYVDISVTRDGRHYNANVMAGPVRGSRIATQGRAEHPVAAVRQALLRVTAALQRRRGKRLARRAA